MEVGQLKNKVWRLAKRPVGDLKEGDLQLHEESLPETLAEGEFLLKTIYLSIDPSNRVCYFFY